MREFFNRGWKEYAVLTFFEALIGVFMVYPFIGLADGFSRWNLALEICENGKVLSNTLLSPVISYFQALTWKAFNSYAVFTLIQAWLFYIAIGINVADLIPYKEYGGQHFTVHLWVVVAQLIVLFPTVYVFPLLLTDSALIYILLVFLYSILRHKGEKFFLPIIVVALCVSIRINSLVLMVLLTIFFIISATRRNTRKYIITSFELVLGSIIGLCLPILLVPNSNNAAVLGMVWEMTGISAQYSNDDLRVNLSKYGNIDDAVARYGEPFVNSIVWDRNPPFPAFDISGNKSNELMNLYFDQIIHNTKHFLSVKGQFIASSLGIADRLITSRRGIHYVDQKTIAYGAINTKRQNDIRNLFINVTDSIGFLSLRPIVIIFLAILIVVGMNTLKIKVDSSMSYILIAIGYYSSFLINTQAHEFRYFAPSFFIMFVVIVCGLVSLIGSICKVSLNRV